MSRHSDVIGIPLKLTGSWLIGTRNDSYGAAAGSEYQLWVLSRELDFTHRSLFVYFPSGMKLWEVNNLHRSTWRSRYFSSMEMNISIYFYTFTRTFVPSRRFADWSTGNPVQLAGKRDLVIRIPANVRNSGSFTFRQTFDQSATRCFLPSRMLVLKTSSSTSTFPCRESDFIHATRSMKVKCDERKSAWRYITLRYRVTAHRIFQ